MLKWIVSLAAVAVLSVSVWLLVQRDQTVEEVGAREAQTPIGPSDRYSAPLNPVVDAGAAPSQRLPEAGREELGVAPSDGAPGIERPLSAEIAVQVVRKAGGASVPAAQVFFVDRSLVDAAVWQKAWREGRQEHFVRTRGARLTADDRDGICRRCYPAGLCYRR